MILSKYAVALLQIALVITASLTTALMGGLDATEAVQLGIMVAGAIAAYWVPLAKGAWVGLLKTGSAIVIAILTALAPLVLQGYILPEQWAIIILAGLNALATETGVQARKDSLIDARGGGPITHVA